MEVPLIETINEESEEIIKYITEHGDDPNKKDKFGTTTL